MIQVKIRGVPQVIANMGKKQLQMKSAALKWVDMSADELRHRVAVNIGLYCHSLQKLAAMGHPYSIKHLQNPHSPYYQVHMQSGKMYALLKKEVVSDREAIRGGVGYTTEDENTLTAPSSTVSYLRAIVLEGPDRKVMIGRDFLNGSLNEIIKDAKKNLFTKMRIAARRRT